MDILYRNTSEFENRIIDLMRAEDARGWIKQAEDFITACGARCLLEHVTPQEWLRYYAANAPAYDAVIAELQKVHD